MSKSRIIQLYIGNALPQGNAAESASSISLWQEIQQFFRKRAFSATCAGQASPRSYLISFDAGMLLELMKKALRSRSFDAWRQEYARNPNRLPAPTLVVEVSSVDGAPEEAEAYEVATLFLQQLVVAVNLIQPGACRLGQTMFKGDGAHRYEAQNFDCRLYYGAFRNLRDLGWWQRHNPGFIKVWQWLERAEGSHEQTALRSLDKVLFTALKVAEQRNEQSSRTALLVIYQLEVLLDCRNPMDARHLRNRIRLILGDMPEAADCINELYGLRDGLLLGSRPVQRPALVFHDDIAEFMEQVDPHNNVVEMGTALVLVLLRELISHDAQAFVFTESVALQHSQQA